MLQFFENLIGLFGPDKGLRLLVVDSNEFLNCSNQVRDTLEDSAPYPFPSQFRKPALDQVQPGGTRRREMQVKARMFPEPFFHPRMGMGSVVVQDQMDIQRSGCFAINLSQKFQKLLVTVTRIAGPNDCPFQNIQGGKQRGCPVAFVIMCHCAAATLLHWQPRLGAVQGLNLRLLVDTQDQRFLGGIQIKSDHIGELFHKTLVVGHLEGFDPVRLKSVGIPNPSHGHVAYPELSSQRSSAPMCGGRRPGMQRSFHDEVHGLGLCSPRTRPVRGIFRDPRRTFFFKPQPPQNNRRSRRPQPFGDGIIRYPFGGHKTNPRTEDNSLRRCPRLSPGFQGLSLFRGHSQGLGWFPHTPMINRITINCQAINVTLH